MSANRQTEKVDPTRCSLAEAERWLGVSRQTLAKWLDRGAPVVERPDTKGKPVLVSIPELHRWAVARAAEEGEAKARKAFEEIGGFDFDDPSRMPKEEADRRKAVAEALRTEIKLHNEAGSLVPVEEVGPAVARHLAPVRERLMSLHRELPEKLERRTGISARISTNMIRDEIDKCLAQIAKDVDFSAPENGDIPDDDTPSIED